jgi:hypothetical protein
MSNYYGLNLDESTLSASFLKNWADPINDIIYSNVFASDILFDAKVLLITDYALQIHWKFCPSA